MTDWWGGWPQATVQMWAKPDFTPGPGQNRGLFLQGTIGEPASVAGIAVYWRAAAANAAVTKPWFSTFNCSTTQNQGYTISDKDRQLTVNQLFHATWRSGEAPKNYLQGALLPVSSSSTSTGTIAKLGSGNLYLGETTTDNAGTYPRTGPWSGLLDEVRLRAVALPPEHIAAEYDNWSTPQLFYGIGGEDLPTDSNAAPLAFPNFDVPTDQNREVPIDLVADDYDPEGGTKTLLATFGTPTPASSGTVTKPVGGNTALFTPAGGFTGRSQFSYTLQEPGGKQATGWCSVLVAPGTTPASGDDIPVATAANTFQVANATTNSGRMENLVAAINTIGNPTSPTWLLLPDGVYDATGASAGTSTAKAQVTGGNLTIRTVATVAAPLVIVSKTLHGATLKAHAGAITLNGANVIMYRLRSEHKNGAIAGTRNRWCRCRVELVQPTYVAPATPMTAATVRSAASAMSAYAFSFQLNGTRGRVDHCEITVDDFPTGDYYRGFTDLLVNGFPIGGPRRHAFFLNVTNVNNQANINVIDPAQVHTFFSIDSNWIHHTPPKPEGTVYGMDLTRTPKDTPDQYWTAFAHTFALGTTAATAYYRCCGLVYHNIIEDCMTSDGLLEPKTSDLTVWGNTCRRWGNTGRRTGKGQINNRQGANNTWMANHCRNIGNFDMWSGPHMVVGNDFDGTIRAGSGTLPAGSWSASGFEACTAVQWYGHTGAMSIGFQENTNADTPAKNNTYDRPASGVAAVGLAATGTVYNATVPGTGYPPTGVPPYTAAAALTSPTMSVVDVAQSGTNTAAGEAGPWAPYTALPAWGPGFTTRSI